MTHDNNDIDTLITRVLSGEATADEQQRLDDWIKDPVNDARFQQAKRAFELTGKYLAKGKSVPLINVDEEWKKFQDRVGASEDRTIPLVKTPWIRIAAALLIVLAGGFVISYLLSRPAEITFATAMTTQRIELPDGSVVTLNRNSTFAYDEDFNNKERLVRLSGEAFFDVAPDSQKPFKISSGNATVEVVGTSFNVSAYNSDEQVTVTVETGVVRLSATSEEEKLELRPGEVGTYTKSSGGLAMTKNPDVNYRSWTTRHIEFNGTSLQEVVRTLNKTYGSEISIVSAVPADCVVTVTFDQQTLDAVLRVLETTLNLTYRINGNKIEITSAKC